MHAIFISHRAKWLAISLVIASILACSLTQATQVNQNAKFATQFVRATQVNKRSLCEGTMIAPVTLVVHQTQIVGVTREVETIIETVVVEKEIAPVTQIAQETQIVEVTREVTREVIQTVVVEVERETPTATSVPGPTLTSVVASPPVWYDFEDDSMAAGIIEDRSGNDNDAQVIGSVDFVEGISGGQAIRFSGEGYLLTQSNPAAGRKNISFSLWFKTTNPENNYKFASAAWWSGGPASGWVLATHIPEFWSDDTKSLFMPGLSNLENGFPTNEWVHEVVTYDGQRIKEYTDGSLVNDWPATGAAIGLGQPMVIGGWPSAGFLFVGAIDEFRIFDRTLTLDDIIALYNQR